ncbi:dTDP-4-amino-4,6-dideoxygalactose transaminase [Streptomyces zhaozhouensis]|uniref:dTDP-4-amino-4,6-dideoxygalactose transaminase n=1 Tax=Streptomyces zhaozhouensis TaxID=1300267 RepID=A0A286DW46_9ACTN|nr:aminotransferase class I/II-fold pyridoxal phosphate-dependent enzyme [Streptomyces zhaozhouensis]SOD62853.1 dTDP-4-amino-4,6-dideoxygalactose transaminase [Streptomyces zhaozhouensis]
MPVEGSTAPHTGAAWPEWPETDERSVRALARPLLSGRLAVSGARSVWSSDNERAARALADLSGRAHAVLTTNGSSAIVVALHALGIGPGDTVAMPATTWVSCATAVFRVGARPVYFDAAEDSPCGDPAGLAAAPSAVLGIHLYAQAFDVARARAAWPGVPIIEDVSHSQFGTDAHGRRLGGLGDVSIMSLQATKIITCAEGGAVLTDDPGIAARLDSLVMDSRRRTRLPEPEAANELEPAYLLHGANHALPETSAALLLDQLARFPRQAALRAERAALFRALMTDRGWEVAADEGVLGGGTFYGLALRVPDGRPPQDVLREAHARTGATLDRVYPPVPEGPLYRPATVKQYAELARDTAPCVPHSRAWHATGVVVPHQLFLAAPERVERLAAALGRPTTAREWPLPAAGGAAASESAPPVIDVVVITRGTRPTLDAALNSVAKQDVTAGIRTTLWLDGTAPVPDVPAALDARVVRVDRGDAAWEDPFDRIAALRDLATRGTTGDFVAFLDDDNEWEEDHLSSLLDLAVGTGSPAVHSWRTLVDAEGRPTPVTRFPWLPPGPDSERRFRELCAAGVMGEDPVIRDGLTFALPDGGGGMVDMGEWLFERRLLGQLAFRRPRSRREIAERLGEDDILLEQLVALDVPVRCTRQPTLRYRLGGMSNSEYGDAPPPVPDAPR